MQSKKLFAIVSSLIILSSTLFAANFISGFMGKGISVELKRASDWNLVGICQDIDVKDINMSNIQEIQDQDGNAVYTGEFAEFSSLKVLKAGYGYWIKGSGVFNVGEALNKVAVPLNRNDWSLMAVCEDMPKTAIDMSKFIEIQDQDGKAIKTGEFAEFSNLDMLKAGNGYWVKGNKGTIFIAKKGVSLPKDFKYPAINNSGEVVIENLNNLTVKLFSDANITANSQQNHIAIVVRDENNNTTNAMSIQSDYKNKNLVAALYNENNKLVAVSDIFKPTQDNSFLDIDLSKFNINQNNQDNWDNNQSDENITNYPPQISASKDFVSLTPGEVRYIDLNITDTDDNNLTVWVEGADNFVTLVNNNQIKIAAPVDYNVSLPYTHEFAVAVNDNHGNEDRVYILMEITEPNVDNNGTNWDNNNSGDNFDNNGSDGGYVDNNGSNGGGYSGDDQNQSNWDNNGTDGGYNDHNESNWDNNQTDNNNYTGENRPPIIDIYDDYDVYVETGKTKNISLNIYDPDGDSVDVKLIGNPPYVTYKDGNITIAPKKTDFAFYGKITIEAIDSYGNKVYRYLELNVNKPYIGYDAYYEGKDFNTSLPIDESKKYYKLSYYSSNNVDLKQYSFNEENSTIVIKNIDCNSSYVLETLKYTKDGNVYKILSDNNDSDYMDRVLSIEKIANLNATELNSYYGRDIFKNGDRGILIAQKVREASVDFNEYNITKPDGSNFDSLEDFINYYKVDGAGSKYGHFLYGDSNSSTGIVFDSNSSERSGDLVWIEGGEPSYNAGSWKIVTIDGADVLLLQKGYDSEQEAYKIVDGALAKGYYYPSEYEKYILLNESAKSSFISYVNEYMKGGYCKEITNNLNINVYGYGNHVALGETKYLDINVTGNVGDVTYEIYGNPPYVTLEGNKIKIAPSFTDDEFWGEITLYAIDESGAEAQTYLQLNVEKPRIELDGNNYYNDNNITTLDINDSIPYYSLELAYDNVRIEKVKFNFNEQTLQEVSTDCYNNEYSDSVEIYRNGNAYLMSANDYDNNSSYKELYKVADLNASQLNKIVGYDVFKNGDRGIKLLIKEADASVEFHDDASNVYLDDNISLNDVRDIVNIYKLDSNRSHAKAFRGHIIFEGSGDKGNYYDIYYDSNLTTPEGTWKIKNIDGREVLILINKYKGDGVAYTVDEYNNLLESWYQPTRYKVKYLVNKSARDNFANFVNKYVEGKCSVPDIVETIETYNGNDNGSNEGGYSGDDQNQSNWDNNNTDGGYNDNNESNSDNIVYINLSQTYIQVTVGETKYVDINVTNSVSPVNFELHGNPDFVTLEGNRIKISPSLTQDEYSGPIDVEASTDNSSSYASLFIDIVKPNIDASRDEYGDKNLTTLDINSSLTYYKAKYKHGHVDISKINLDLNNSIIHIVGMDCNGYTDEEVVNFYRKGDRYLISFDGSNYQDFYKVADVNYTQLNKAYGYNIFKSGDRGIKILIKHREELHYDDNVSLDNNTTINSIEDIVTYYSKDSNRVFDSYIGRIVFDKNSSNKGHYYYVYDGNVTTDMGNWEIKRIDEKDVLIIKDIHDGQEGAAYTLGDNNNLLVGWYEPSRYSVDYLINNSAKNNFVQYISKYIEDGVCNLDETNLDYNSTEENTTNPDKYPDANLTTEQTKELFASKTYYNSYINGDNEQAVEKFVFDNNATMFDDYIKDENSSYSLIKSVNIQISDNKLIILDKPDIYLTVSKVENNYVALKRFKNGNFKELIYLYKNENDAISSIAGGEPGNDNNVSDSNVSSNEVYLEFIKKISNSDYEEANALKFEPNKKYYSLAYYKNEYDRSFHLSYHIIDTQNDIVKGYKLDNNGTYYLAKTAHILNDDNEILLDVDDDNVTDIKTKLTKVLTDQELNQETGLDIFTDEDEGYVIYQFSTHGEQVGDAEIYFNESAKDKLLNYINSLENDEQSTEDSNQTEYNDANAL